MARLMTIFEACRQECAENPIRYIDQHRCLTYHVTKTTMVVRLNYSEWNSLAPPSTSMCGTLIRCYFNPSEPRSNYIVAYGSTKAESKRAIRNFLERYPLACISEPSTIQHQSPSLPVSASPFVNHTETLMQS